MSFLHSSFFFALAFLAIPIIVHLYNLRRYRKEYFSNTSILKSILNQTDKTSKLKKRLLLASRLLAMFFCILAFVQPYLSTNQSLSQSIPIISIYIDNSQSMDLPSTNQKALTEAKQKALEIIHQAENQAQYQIISNQLNGRELQILNYQDAVDQVNSLDICSTPHMSNEIWQKQIKTSQSQPNAKHEYYWISDFQRGQFNALDHSDESLICIPIQHQKHANIYIDTAYIHSPVFKLNQDVTIFYRARKFRDDHNVKAILTLTQNNQVKHRKEVNFGKEMVITDSFKVKILTSDWQDLKLSITDPNIEYDNDYYFSLFVSKKPSVTYIGNSVSQSFLTNALKADDNFDIHSSSSVLSADELKQTNLILLNELSSLPNSETIDNWLKANKNIALFIPQNSNIPQYNSVLEKIGIQSIQNYTPQKTRIKQINQNDPLLKGVFANLETMSDLPSFNGYHILGGHSSRAKEVLMSFDNGLPFLIKYSRMGEGNIYLFSAPISSSQSDFVYSSIFAPLMYKIGSIASSFQVNSHTIGQNLMINIPINLTSQDKVFKLVGDNISYIPPQRNFGQQLSFSLDQNIQKSGFYYLLNHNQEKEFHLAFNYSRKESVLDFLSTDEISKVLQHDNINIDHDNHKILNHTKSLSGTYLWKVWVVLAIICLLIEMMITNYWERILEIYSRIKFNSQ